MCSPEDSLARVAAIAKGIASARAIARAITIATAAARGWRVGCLVLLVPATAALAAPGDLGAFRFRAAVVVEHPGAFLELALPPAVYARSRQHDLRDLRIVDSKGEQVPFALPPARAVVQAVDLQRDAALYALPARPAANGEWPSPLEVTIVGDHVRVRRSGPAATLAAAASGGWLIDLGERRADEPSARSLRLDWSGPAEFSAAYRIESSDDLQHWQGVGSGQLMALPSPAGALTQPVVELGAPARFVRLLWADAATAPRITAVHAVRPERTTVALDPPSALTFAPGAMPVGKGSPSGVDVDAARALHFDLGGVLPLVEIGLRFASGSRIAPVRLQGRDTAEERWRDLGQAVFYRLERDATVSRSPDLALLASVRYVRVLPDPRSAALDPAQTTLAVQAQLAHAVFVAQGVPPYALLTGSSDAVDGALPIAALVPQLDTERARFGRATLGAFVEVESAARAADAVERQAERRPWLLWGVLLIGVAALGAMVWRLTRSDGSSTAAVADVPPSPD